MSPDWPVYDGSRLRDDILKAMDRIRDDTSYPAHRHIVLPTAEGDTHCIECGAALRLPVCNGICLTGSDIGIPSNSIAVAHPECEKHGHLATHNTDGTPRT